MQKRAAFSLVEMSIVLAIIGLLVGGVLAGQSLIRSSTIRSVGNEYQKYIAAVQQFQMEFNALPGDFSGAIAIWGAAHATPATCVTTIGTGTQTCDGDSNGLLATNAAGSNEIYRFWQHLSNAGLIAGQYTGVRGDVAVNSSTTANSPASKIANSLWYVYNWGAITGNAGYFEGDYYNSLVLGGAVANNWPSGANMRPEEMYNIDVKLDDGKPALGKIWANPPTGCTDNTYLNGATANYNLTSKTTDCRLFAPNAFYRNF